MQTVHPILKRGCLYWDRDLLPKMVFEHRLRAIQDAIAAAGDDAWVIYGDAQEYGNVAYVSHFLPRTRSALILVPRLGAPTLLASVGARDVPATKTLTWFDDVRPFTRLPREAVRLLIERGLGEAHVGLVGMGRSLSVTDWEAIAGELPAVQWHERDETLQRMRAHKQAEELSTMERAAEVVQAGLHRAGDALIVGQSMRKVAAEIDLVMRRNGAEDVRLLVASGEQAGKGLRPVDDRLLAMGDAVLIFAAAEVQRYWAEGAQTYVLGTASDELRALADKAWGAVQGMASAAHVGASTSAVAQAALDRLGSAELRTSAEAYGLGHGIGLDAEESPTIGDEAYGASILEDGATLGLHIVLHDRLLGAISGRTVSVTQEGTRALLATAPLVECNIRS